jgi:phosphate-selective porin OprO and OprP
MDSISKLGRLSGAIVAGSIAAWLVLSATSAFAQGMYYKEITKDGRIYVFNVAANAERFEKTGEMGIGVTKPGAGPNGETVVGDNERALQLYFFKHGISEPVPDPVQPIQTVVWRDGKTRITTDGAYLELSTRVQVRFTEESPSDNLSLPVALLPGEDRGSFRIRRFKTKLEGWMIKSWLTYETQLNWPDLVSNNAINANPGAFLEDAAFDIDFTKGKGLFRLHVGQFKPPWGAQEMTSSGNQQFVDRALVSNAFFRGRETGLAAWGTSSNNKFEWRVGMFNGNGRTRTFNDNYNHFQYNARLMWQPNGSQVLNQRAWITGALYSEADHESTTTPIYAVAINFENQNNFGATTAIDQKWNAFSVDGIYKYKGFSSNFMYSLAMRTNEATAAGGPGGSDGSEVEADGYFIQAGYLFHRRTWEVAVRYAENDPSDLIARNIVKETRGALSYYYLRHVLKWQNDFGQVVIQLPAGGETKLFEFRSQLQFIF